MRDYYYALGPWEWWGGGEPGWQPPAGAIAAVDLRGYESQALAGTYGDRPYGFFATTAPLDSAYTALGRGDCREIQVTGALQDAWQSLLGYRPTGAYLVDLLWDQLTAGSDPSGDTPTAPLLPTVRGVLELHLPGHSVVRSERFEWGKHSHTGKVRDRLHRDYRRLHAEAAAGRLRPGQERRVLGFWREQYRLSGDGWRELVPPELRRGHPGPLPHETTRSDDFNRADAGSIGSSSEGWSWSVLAGGIGISSNQAINNTATTGATARAEADLSSADHYAQLVQVFGSTTLRCAVPYARFSPSALTGYLTIIRASSAGLYKRVTGTYTQLVDLVEDATAGLTLKIECNGSAIASYKNGVLQGSITDTAITGNLRSGMEIRNQNDTADDFLAADLSAGVPSHFLHYARLRAAR